ncbi:VWA domain-containing protein [Actinospica durhamensis]|uniref:VWA domain-containing protein n=1 Tax=Actinospica durhamensis TaxID=1508375 RepID=A0A941IMU8_9ACTN|nr:VWA domain-containing protein [Actinospica durhamensis]MBR7834615.1 VWA domain-containing protein [Actinospica durhamensis]
MSAQPQFTVNVYQNEYLSEGAAEVNAIVSVQSAAAFGGTSTARAAQVIMVDCSGSMDYPPTKMAAARQATEAAIDAIRDGVPFAVVAGTHVARMVFPGTEYLVPADASSRAAAKAAVARLTAGGGTAIGQWLALADRLFTGHEQAIRHAILLTDGKDEHEEPADLAAALARCEGRFTCDCRGIGTDWVVAELRRVSTALLGTVDIVADPGRLATDFQQIIEHAMGKAVGDVRLRLWTPQGAQVKFVKQVAPQILDLTGRRSPGPNPLTGDFPTGAWGPESRDYQVCVQVRPGSVGDEMLAARVSLVSVEGSGAAVTLGQGLVRAVWSDDVAQTGRIDRTVADYTGQAELAEAIREGLEARKNGDLDTATARLGRAVKLATQAGNEDTAILLAKVVDIDDPATGTVRLKQRVSDADEMTLDTRSTRTVRVGKNRNENG